MPHVDDAHSRIYTRRDDDAPDTLSVAGGTVAVVSRRSPAKDTDNEDSAAVLGVDARRAVLVVADGVGGHVAGAEASALAIAALAETVGAIGPDDELRTAVLRGIELANERITALGLGAATTLAVAEIDGDTVRTYHVGDSEILIVGQRGRIHLQTIAHSPVGYAMEAGVLDGDQAIHHEDRHIVSNVVGAADMRIEMGPIVRLRARDTVLLATDGLFDNLYQPEIITGIRCGRLDRAAAALATAARARMTDPEVEAPSKPDDLTFVIYRPARSRAGRVTDGD